MRPWLVLLLCGCNAVFDLQETKSIAGLPDRDSDGKVDGDDNCLEVSNPEQEDFDKDGFGDACDGCPMQNTLLNHDEDGDGRGDDCDLCPGQPEFEGDTDGDGIGDTCDDLMGMGTRLVFDTFRVLEPAWTPGATEWRVTNDAVSPVAALPANDYGLRASELVLDGSRAWSVHIGVHAKASWKTDDFGAVLLDDNDNVIASCKVACSPSCAVVGSYRSYVYASPQEPTPMFDVVFSLVPVGGGYVSLKCGRIGSLSALSANGSAAGHLAIVASPNAEITYVEVLE